MSLIQDVQNDFDPANLKIFTGVAKLCSYSTIGTTLVDCCNTDPTELLGACNAGEIDLANDRRAKKAHYVGTFCSSYVSLGLGRVCVENEEVWCSFRSELGRIVQEQGRPQLGITWGAASTPNCDGFTVSQFGSLNFAAMDLSEFYSSITTSMDSAAIGTKMHEKACIFKTGSPSC
jgi:conjugal transfer mating pair stabilization protein TraN